MAKIETVCPKCHKHSYTLDVKKLNVLGGMTRTTLSCGHVMLSRDTHEENISNIRDEFWDKLFPFQRQGVEFVEKADFHALIADEMGLGKTVQALATLRYHSELLPALYIVKSGVKYQWQAQIKTWLENKNDMFANVAQVVINGNSEILPLQHTIISMDMLEKFSEKIIARGFKTIIIDESQNFKDMSATRTEALMKIVSAIKPIGVLCLTGTPVLNRASEFFTTLNLLRPGHWRTYDGFVRNWCERNVRGTNIGGIRYSRKSEFHEITKNYVIRREKREVMKDLPPFRRNYEWIVIEDERIRDAYNNQLKTLQSHLNTMDKIRNDAKEQMALLGMLEKLRQLCAISKIPWVLDYVTSFLTVEEDEKIIIGLHHNIAIEFLSDALKDYRPIIIDGRDSAEAKFQKLNLFKTDPKRRVIIASILAAGEGMDGLQHVCSNMLTLERMWNLSKERQFEARLDRYGQTNSVSNTLLLAKGTIDEYFTEIILEKEKYVLTTQGGIDESARMEQHFQSLNYADLASKCASNFI